MSTLRIDNIGPSAGGTTRSAVRGIAAAWANLNGTGTIALRDSLNVSSVVDDGTGDYSHNFTNVFATANIKVGSSVDRNNNASYQQGLAVNFRTPTTGAIRCWTGIVGATDALGLFTDCHGDLA